MKHNRLNKSRCYLCGPMDRVPDHGVQWRDDLTPFLEKMGVVVLNPARKPSSAGIEDDDFRQKRDRAKQNKDWDQISEMMSEIVHVDLRMVDVSDFLIVNLDTTIYPAGTTAEMTTAALQRKPVIVHCPQGKGAVPEWWFGHLKHELFFETWDAVKCYLDHVNRSPTRKFDTLGRWVLFGV